MLRYGAVAQMHVCGKCGNEKQQQRKRFLHFVLCTKKKKERKAGSKRSRFEGLNVGKSREGTKEPLCYTELSPERKAQKRKAPLATRLAPL